MASYIGQNKIQTLRPGLQKPCLIWLMISTSSSVFLLALFQLLVSSFQFYEHNKLFPSLGHYHMLYSMPNSLSNLQNASFFYASHSKYSLSINITSSENTSLNIQKKSITVTIIFYHNSYILYTPNPNNNLNLIVSCPYSCFIFLMSQQNNILKREKPRPSYVSIYHTTYPASSPFLAGSGHSTNVFPLVTISFIYSLIQQILFPAVSIYN